MKRTINSGGPRDPLQQFLARLRERGLDVAEPSQGQYGPQYQFQCPGPDHKNGDRNPSGSISVGKDGQVVFQCHGGCEKNVILKALGLEWRDLYPEGLTLELYGQAKQLPIDYLKEFNLREARRKKKPVVLFPYVAEDGKTLLSTRIRWSLNGEPRFTWEKGDKPGLYGLPVLSEVRKRGYVVLCEGESDTQTLLYHDIPALGVPGVDTWNNEWTSKFDGIETLYAIVEPDTGGETLKRKLLASPLRSRLKFITLRGHKDPSDLHIAVNGDHDAFMTAWNEAKHQAQSSPEPPRGVELLAEVEQIIRRYIYLPDDGMYLLLAVYILFTHVAQRFYALGYLAIDSPVPECGKSTLGAIIKALSANGKPCVNITSAALFRIIDEDHPTMVIDEADGLLRDPEKGPNLILIINSGYKKGTPVIRLEPHGKDWVTREFDVFGPKVLIGINLNRLPEATRSRCIPVHMSRAVDEPVEEFDEETLKPVLEGVNQRIAEFAAAQDSKIKALYSAVRIPELKNRSREIYGPLFATLAVIAPNRLPELRATVARLVNLRTEEGPTQPGLRLLLDIRGIFDECQQAAFSTSDLIDHLKKIPEGPWADWKGHHLGIQPRELAWLLKPFGIKSHNMKLADGKVAKGYRRADLEDAWRRYLPTEKSPGILPSAPATAATELNSQKDNSCSVSATEGSGSGTEIEPSHLKINQVAGVAPESQAIMANISNNHIWGDLYETIEIPDFD